jgi:AraC-like DNA-binding protein
MTIYIKNMVCLRCKQKVAVELDRLGIESTVIQLGKVELSTPLSAHQLEKLRTTLSLYGLEVMRNRNEELVEKIKTVVMEMVDDSGDELTVKHSEFISDKLGKKYTYLARVFVEVTGMSIRQFVISHRVELTKTLIRQNRQSLTEIAFQLNYSSIGHLSNQFKDTTGISPSVYRRISGGTIHKRVMAD